MKIVSIVGARPQFVKAAVVSRVLREKHTEVPVHTGQHYDDNMSEVFFRELGIPEPNINLGVGSGTHGVQTGEMLRGLETIIRDEQPDWVLIYGDTNSTLAGALAAAKLCVPVAHVEAGLRSFNRSMPEEINRVLADRLSALLLCPSQTAVDNLAREGISDGVHLVGDVMADALNYARAKAEQASTVLESLGLSKGSFLLATVHRAENTNDRARLTSILGAFNAVGETIVFPVHPRTRKIIEELGFGAKPHVRLIEPVGYLDMIMLEQSARMVLTDSGGMQKEAYWLGTPCITLRDETEWVETVDAGWNALVGADTRRILQAIQTMSTPASHPSLYGDGHAAERCVEVLAQVL